MTEASTPNTIPGRVTEEDIAWLEGLKTNSSEAFSCHPGNPALWNARIDRLIAMARSRSDDRLECSPGVEQPSVDVTSRKPERPVE